MISAVTPVGSRQVPDRLSTVTPGKIADLLIKAGELIKKR
jgi:hypothetical protein